MVAALAYIQMRDAIGPKPRGFTAIGVFLFFGAVMASLAATTLLWRGTVLDRLWTLNPTAYKQLAPLGRIVGILFLALSAALTTAEIGWFQRRLWGWGLAVVISSTQVLGDVVNCARGDWLRGGTGRDHRWCTIAVSVAAKNQSRIRLELLSTKFKRAITDERGDHGTRAWGSPTLATSDCRRRLMTPTVLS
jgi:hypothetical protein